MKASSITFLFILLLIPVISLAVEPGFRANLEIPATSFISPYPDEWEDPIISMNLDELHPGFNYKLLFTSPPKVESSSHYDSSITFSYVYYSMGRDYPVV